MLQLTRDSPIVALNIQQLRDAEERAEKAIDYGLLATLAEATTFYIVYAGTYYAAAAAEVLYWPLAQLTDKRVEISTAEQLMYHVLAYHDERASVVAFIEPGNENTLIRLSDACRFTGAKLVAIAPPLPPPVESRFNGEELLVVERTPLATTFTLIAAKMAAYMAEKVSGIRLRLKRVSEEYRDVSGVYTSLIEEYRRTLDEIALIDEAAIYASATTMPAARLSSLALLAAGGYARVEPLTALLSDMSHKAGREPLRVIIYTDVEADIAKEARFKARFMETGRLLELQLHTDPVTAPLYSALLGEYIVANKLYGERAE